MAGGVGNIFQVEGLSYDTYYKKKKRSYHFAKGGNSYLYKIHSPH